MCQCLPTSWDSLRLASPLLHSFLPSPLSTYKGERRRKGVKQVESCGWKGRWKGWIWLERLGEDDARLMRGWSEVGAMVEWRVGCGEGDQKLIPSTRIHLLYLFTSFARSTPWDSLLPFSLSRGFFSSLPLSTLLHVHLRSIPSFLFPKRILGAESVERSEQGWKAERIKWSWGDGRGHDEELGGGRSERQMDGEKEHVHQIDASNSSWLLSYLAVSFSKLLESSIVIAFSSSILYLLAKIKIKMYVYFLFWTYFSMCIGTSLLRHDSKAAVPLQSIGWSKAFCLSGNVKVHAFHCFFCEGGARANRGWSKGWNEGWSEGLRRSPKIDTNDAYLFRILLDPLLVLLPLPFHFSANLFSSIPLSTLLHVHLCLHSTPSFLLWR